MCRDRSAKSNIAYAFITIYILLISIGSWTPFDFHTSNFRLFVNEYFTLENRISKSDVFINFLLLFPLAFAILTLLPNQSHFFSKDNRVASSIALILLFGLSFLLEATQGFLELRRASLLDNFLQVIGAIVASTFYFYVPFSMRDAVIEHCRNRSTYLCHDLVAVGLTISLGLIAHSPIHIHLEWHEIYHHIKEFSFLWSSIENIDPETVCRYSAWLLVGLSIGYVSRNCFLLPETINRSALNRNVISGLGLTMFFFLSIISVRKVLSFDLCILTTFAVLTFQILPFRNYVKK